MRSTRASYQITSKKASQEPSFEGRLLLVTVLFSLLAVIILGRLFQLQVVEGKTYKILASDQHEVQAQLVPRRGTLYVQDRFDQTLHPVAKDRDAWQVFMLKREMKEDQATSSAVALGPVLDIPPEELLAKFLSPTTTYAVLAREVDANKSDEIKALKIPGIGVTKVLARFYPEQGLGGQVFGFVGQDDAGKRQGKYGIEGEMDAQLSGTYGSLSIEKDARGRRLSIGTTDLSYAVDGSDIVLTLDRTIQYEACQHAADAVARFQADSASITVMDPKTGEIWAMCSAPDYDPANYRMIDDIGVLNNPATFVQFEPGSTFKAFTLAAGIDAEKINPNTTYVDTGEEKIDDFTIRNSDKLAHGTQTMTQVLEESLNTGTIFVQRLLGKDLFRDYMEKFGFGKKTGIEVAAEASGDLRPLEKKGQIYAATASFGQGISVTPIQMLAAFGALANNGILMQPHLVREVIHPDGTVIKTPIQELRQVISSRSSRLIGGMLVGVVEKGHGKHASVPGYYVAGKTGTAQIPDTKNGGYLTDGTIGNFAGYAPVENPRFVMYVKIVKPRTVQYAESSAAPVFGEMASFLLSYLQVPPERPYTKKPELPPLPVVTSTTATKEADPTASSTENGTH
ncbi:MAG: penicillin-binding protein 2 [Candidatus Magasanikbacteria bacterium]|nr:penicillin-binding protein 2 [Candidatus Magasanikbacteria bacterium]